MKKYVFTDDVVCAATVIMLVVLSVITVFCLNSCNLKNNNNAVQTAYKYRYAAATASVADEITLIFIPVRRSGDTDTEILCYNTLDLYKKLNIKALDYDSFCENIFERIVSSTAIELSENAYHYLSDGIITPVQKIDSLYAAAGIAHIVKKMNSFSSNDCI